MFKKLYIYLIVFLSANLSLAQQQLLSGIVKDSLTDEPLAFVNIVYNNNNNGTITNIDGKFHIDKSNNIEYIRVSYLGYNPIQISRDKISKSTFLNIYLKPSTYQISEATVLPGINPAHRIIENAINNKKINNPENLDTYSYSSYNKLHCTIDRKTKRSQIDTIILPDSLIHKYKKLQTDSSKKKSFIDFFEDKHIFLMETASQRSFKSPDKIKETVIANKVSGLKNPSFVILATQLQSFSFYENQINIFDLQYFNPISKGSVNKYLFIIEDTIFNEKQDSIFAISYRPYKGKNFDGLKGVLHINSNKYAIQTVTAEPAEQLESMNLRIQQKYEHFNNEQWFPVELNTDIIFTTLELDDRTDTFLLNDSTIIKRKDFYPLVGIGKSYIKNIRINPNLDTVKFNNIEVSLGDSIHLQDEKVWNNYRPDSLSDIDQKTYQIIDSISKAANLEKTLAVFETLIRGKIPISIFSLDIAKLMAYNEYEGYRLCADLMTNDKVSKWFSIGGYYAYGFKDKQAKYGARILFSLHKKSELTIQFSSRFDVSETGKYHFLNEKSVLATNIYRDIYVKRMYQSNGSKAEISFRALRYFKANIFLKNERNNYFKFLQYSFYDPENRHISYTTGGELITENTETGINIKYIYKEKFMETPKGGKISLGSNYPVIYANFSKGWNFFSGDFDYLKAEFKIDKTFKFRSFGKTNIQIVGAATNKPLPEWMIYNGRGSYKNFAIESAGSFGTMRINEFTNDRILYVFFRHNFKSLLFKSKIFKPQIVLCQNIGYGSLTHPEYHSGYNQNFVSMEKGYYESGVLINNIISQSLFGYGIGVFYRYGPYMLDNYKDNLALKFTLYTSI